MTEPDPRVWHVYPLHEPGHELTGYECWCRPQVQRIDPATGMINPLPIIVHRDAAQRAAEAS